MAFSAIPSSATDQNSPGDQTLMDLFRLNLDDHEARIKVAEDPSARTFSHFNVRHGFTSNRILDQVTTVIADTIYDAQFWLALSASGSPDARWVEAAGASDTTFQHWIMLEFPSGGDEGALYTLRSFKFSDVTKPLFFKGRFKLSNNTMDVFIGMARAEYTNLVVPARGIYLERNTTNWRFVAKDSAGSTDGTPFAPVTAGTWFDVEIRFEDTPGNQARCYVDGVLKETFSTNLPTGEVLVGTAKAGQVAGDLKTDRLEFKAGAQLADAA